jgi:putative ATPase
MKELGYGDGYKYAHDFENKIADMQCLPENLKERIYYAPTGEGEEKKFREKKQYLQRLKSDKN